MTARAAQDSRGKQSAAAAEASAAAAAAAAVSSALGIVPLHEKMPKAQAHSLQGKHIEIYWE